jgi:hypothetical protein
LLNTTKATNTIVSSYVYQKFNLKNAELIKREEINFLPVCKVGSKYINIEI